MSLRHRTIAALLHAYPRAWRREYGPELADILFTQPIDARVIGNVLWNGFRQRLDKPPLSVGVAMTSIHTPPDTLAVFLWRRKFWVVATVMLGAGIALGLAMRMPQQFRSEAIIGIEPRLIPEGIIPSRGAIKLQDTLAEATQRVLSRTHLERVVLDLDLYSAERKRAITMMEELVQRTRAGIAISVLNENSIRVAALAGDPRTAMLIAERITIDLIEQSTRGRERSTQAIDRFLETMLGDAAVDLVERETKLAQAHRQNGNDVTVLAMEYEMTQAQYRSLFAKRQEARLSATLEGRQTGQQFTIIDPARRPAGPIGPDVTRITLLGALTGLASGLVFVLIAHIRRLSRGGLAGPADEPAVS